MTAADSTAVAQARPDTLVSFVALYRLLLRTQITVTRLLGIAALGALSLLLGVFARLDDNSAAGGRRRRRLVRARSPRPVRDALARHLGDRRPHRRPPARLRLVEARGAVAASCRGGSWPRSPSSCRSQRSRLRRLRSLRDPATSRSRRFSQPRSESSHTRASSSRPASGSGARSGGGWPSSCCGRTSSPTRWKARLASPSPAGLLPFSGWCPISTCPLEPGSAAAAFVVLAAIAVAGWLVATWRYRRADVD